MSFIVFFIIFLLFFASWTDSVYNLPTSPATTLRHPLGRFFRAIKSRIYILRQRSETFSASKTMNQNFPVVFPYNSSANFPLSADNKASRALNARTYNWHAKYYVRTRFHKRNQNITKDRYAVIHVSLGLCFILNKPKVFMSQICMCETYRRTVFRRSNCFNSFSSFKSD